MKPLSDAEFNGLTRKYRFQGGRVRAVRIARTKTGLTVAVAVKARTALVNLDDEPKPVTVRLTFEGVEEYRFQKRYGATAGRVPEARFGIYDGLYYAVFDAYPLEKGDRPGVHDYRAGDYYLAARKVSISESA